jgi:AraC-like DNA-binding protein
MEVLLPSPSSTSDLCVVDKSRAGYSSTWYLRVDAEVYRHMPTPLLCRISRLVVRDQYFWKPHRHQEFEWLLCERGRYDFILNGQALRLLPGEAILIQPDDMHEDRCAMPTTFVSVNFHLMPRESQQRILCAEISPQSRIITYKRVEVEPLLTAIIKESATRGSCAAPIQDGLLRAILWHLIRMIPPQYLYGDFGRLRENEAFQMSLADLFEGHLLTGLSVTEMAQTFGLSKRRLEQRCRSILGVSPAHAFRAYRLDRAREFLGDSTLSVKQVSTLVGFPDPFQFSRSFKRQFGYPPSARRDG